MLYRIGLEHPHSTTRERPTKEELLVHYLANFHSRTTQDYRFAVGERCHERLVGLG